jgi:malate permease and related proteins
MQNLALLILCFALGIALRRTGRLPDNAPAALNAVIVNAALPALALVYIHDIPITPGLGRAVMAAWLMFGLAGAFFWVAARMWGLSRETTGALILTAGLANTSFVGLPMIEAFFGRHGMGLGLVIDQLGSYLILATFGVLVASVFSGTAFDAQRVVRKVLTFPPLWGIVVALVLRPFDYPDWLNALLHRLGDLVAPLALLSVGCQLRLGAISGNAAKLGLGLAFKLVIAPLVLAALLVGLLEAEGETVRITLFETAMPPMIGAAIVAMEHKLDPPLITLMVGIGIPLSFLTLPVWHAVLARI